MSVPMISRRKGESPQPEHQIVQVTPELAEKWIGKNLHNRNVRQAKVDQYARDMRNGDWQFNGDPIRFDTDGGLLDGQHRLFAIVESGKTITALVVYNLPSDTQNTMDIGAGRTMGDQLSLAGELDAPLLAAVLRRVLFLNKGYTAASSGGKGVPTHAEMRHYLAENPTIRRAVDVARQSRKYVPCPSSVLGATYHVCAGIDREAADHFFVRQLIEGIGMTATDPARILARKLAEMSDRRGEANTDDVVRYIFLAWNAFCSGKQIQKLQGPRGGWTAANFPHPIAPRLR